MSLIGSPVPPKPAIFAPSAAPPGVTADLDAYDPQWVASRPVIRPRLIVVHTNGGSGEGSYQGAINWSNGGRNRTHAHYNLNEPQPSKNLATDRRSIANSTGRDLEQATGERDVSFWSISIETADRGYRNGGSVDLGDFLHDHAELVARIIAFESIVWDIPIAVPEVWNGAGVVTHTEPWPYPHYTTVRGKTCPGTTKKDRVLRGDILPRAREISDAWLGVAPPTPPPEDDMTTAMRWKHPAFKDQFLVGIGGIERITPGMLPHLSGVPLVEEADENKLTECIAETAITRAHLTPS